MAAKPTPMACHTVHVTAQPTGLVTLLKTYGDETSLLDTVRLCGSNPTRKMLWTRTNLAHLWLGPYAPAFMLAPI